jgi:membrane protein YqaA with SNARE-associated domain
MIYFSLFGISFLSATLFPMGSEALLIYDISLAEVSIIGLWFVATFGNTLGSIVNYILGFKGEGFLIEKKLLKAKHLDKAKVFFDKYGAWTLAFSWLPILGDPLTFVAGVLRYRFVYFVLIVSFAKGSRYAVVIFLARSLSV